MQEERLSRRKNQGGFPALAIERLLRFHGIEWRDVDAYVFGGYETYTEPGLNEGNTQARIRGYRDMVTASGKVRQVARSTPLRRLAQTRRRQRQIQAIMTHGVDRDRISSVDHHLCHASTAHFGAGADRDALILTVDGAGDYLCATVSIPEQDGRLKRLATIDERHSIGNLWAVVTSLLGMVPMEHEYKLMGMAPYASGEKVAATRDIFRSAFRTGDGTWRLAPGVPDMLYSFEYWRKRLEFARFDHICAGLQAFTEDVLTEWAQYWLNATGRRKLRLAGGVFMNVKANMALSQLPEVDDLFVFPSCGDETNSFGAAWAFEADRGQAEHIEPLQSLYLGPDPTDAEYEQAATEARQLGWSVSSPTDMADAIADLVAGGEVVARATGREEFGARALGNRSILADPSNAGVVRTINKAIKSRDFWMPFAPSVMAEESTRYLDNPKKLAAPYMILAFESRNTSEVIAACHPEDATIRPQVVTKEANPSYHRILECFRQKSGRGALLNTSLNIHGEPIVSSPADAIDVMKRSGLIHLALGPFLISKPTST
jgi:carbamoyltransferase